MYYLQCLKPSRTRCPRRAESSGGRCEARWNAYDDLKYLSPSRRLSDRAGGAGGSTRMDPPAGRSLLPATNPKGTATPQGTPKNSPIT